MGKTKKLHLANRILAMMLAVAMSVTMIPSTALAAPADDTAADEIVDVTAEESVDVVVDDDTVDADKDADGADDAGEDADGDTVIVDQGSVDAVTTANEDADADVDAEAETNAEETAPAETSAYEIVWIDGYTPGTKVEYDNSTHFTDFAGCAELRKDGAAVDPAETITAAYQKQGADGNYAAITGTPTDAGKYRVVLTCAAKEGVHAAVTKEVDCEITKAPVTITLTGESRTVKPGTKRSEVAVPVIDEVYGGTNGDVNLIDPDNLTLTITKIKDAVTGDEIAADAELKQGGDYAMDLTPAYTTDTTKLAADKKASFENNFDLQPFTADIQVDNLITTQIIVKLADKWKTEEEKTNNTPATQITYEYTGEAAVTPAETTDYTAEVQYCDDKETDPAKQWKTLTAELKGKWLDECYDEIDGPKDAGSYYYQVSYSGTEGVYAASSYEIPVTITKKQLTVEPADTELTVVANSVASDVLAQIEYNVLDKEGVDVKETVKAAHIWGTTYANSDRSQIYEPLFTMQESADGTTWSDIDDSAKLQKDENIKYRAVFKGRKAVFQINSSSISMVTSITDNTTANGVDTNYYTNYAVDPIDPAKTKTVTITVKPGTKAVIDVSALEKEGEGAKTIDGLTPKQYDGKAIYASRSAYRNVVTLKGEGADGAVIPTEQREFTYTWERYAGGDWIDAQIALKNGTTADALNWRSTNIVSPKDAGVYRLTVSYEDKIDPDAYYYADDAVLYFAIDKRQMTITPTKESYEILEYRDSGDFFYGGEEEIEYTVAAKDGKDLPSDAGYFTAHGQILETITVTGVDPVTNKYVQDSDYVTFQYDKENPTHYAYKLQGYGLRQLNDNNGNWTLASNYTCESSELVQNGTRWERKNTPLNTEVTITVVSMGTQEVTITADTTKWVAKEKVYDAEPFTEAELIPAGLVSVKKADGTDADVKLTYVGCAAGDSYGTALNDIREAGIYDLYVRFDGDKDYAPTGCSEDNDRGIKLGTFKITKREITLTADLDESYPAGTDVSNIQDLLQERYQAAGIVAGQNVWQSNGRKSAPVFYVKEKDGKRLGNYESLQRDKIYEVWPDCNNSLYKSIRHDNNWNSYKPVNDYTIKDAPIATFETVPGNSTILSTDYYENDGSIEAIHIQVQNDKDDPLKREVKMTEAIPWTSGMWFGEGENKEGNFVAFDIYAPSEYDDVIPDTAMYENAIKAKGGYVVGGGIGHNYFTAVFDAAKGDTTFKIRWEDGYVETYTLKFEEAVKLPNLEDAVAPKALAFNAAPKSLAVGQTAQLDVKITKEQMGDVVYLGYKSEDESILAVNQSGYVTALKMGTTGKITVFAQHLVNNKPEPIWDAKKGEGTYAKSATLQIKVTKLDAPKKLKATAHDQSVDLNYDSPAYGYRREIYVMEKDSSYTKPAQFETLLSGMRENQWKQKGFAIAPVYITLGTENTNRKANDYVGRLTGLNVKKDYTIYVRNVCAVRSLMVNGSNVAITQAAMEESASGAVINVKTKKAEVQDLSTKFYSDAWVYDEYGNHVIQFTKLKKPVECMPKGGFPAVSPQDELSSDDLVWIDLPFAGEDKTNYGDVYEEPKLEFLLPDCYDKKTDTWGWGTKNDYASIDKKGKIKITGIPDDGMVYVKIRDTVTGAEGYNGFDLMYENADSVTAAKKSVALSVGQKQYLNDLLTYSIGRTKLTAYPYRSLDLAKVREAIRSQNQAEYFSLATGSDGEAWLTAIQGGGKLELKLTDTNVEKINPDKATVKVTITSKDLDPVKSLKACDVSYNKFGLTFVYPNYRNVDSYLLEVSDAKKPIYSKMINAWDEIGEVYATDKDGRDIPHYDVNGDFDGYATVKDTYQISADTMRDLLNDRNVRLTKDSQYTVSLTPVYDGKKAKTVSAKVKTTKIPAVSGYLTNERYSDDYYDDNSVVWACNQRGGMDITVSEYNRGVTLSNDNTWLTVTSGNTYTLTAEVQHQLGRVNDTLVWTVGDSKVATVKAAAGSYCITLKGMKPGTTKLEVRSKILGNKVIARYNIDVRPVGNAYNSYRDDYDNADNNYYGDNEPDKGD